MRKAYLPLMLLFVISACSSNPSANNADQDATSDGNRTVAVTVEVTDPDAGIVGSRNVVCFGTNGGSHSDPEGACEVLKTVDMDVFSPVSGDTSCTEQFESSLTGNIRGKIAGKDVDADFSLNNGCEIDRWHALDGVWFEPNSGDVLVTR